MTGKVAIFLIKMRRLLHGFCQISIIVDYVVGDCQPVIAACLSGENLTGLLYRFSITRDQSLNLRLFVTIDNQYPIDELHQRGTNEEWYNDHLVRTGCRGCLSTSFSTDARMQYIFEVGPRIGIRKDQTSHGGTIEATRSVDNGITKVLTNFFKCWFAVLYKLPSNDICIDNSYAEFGECVGDSRFSTGNAAGEANSKRSIIVVAGHSEHQINVGILDRLTPEHCDPAGRREIGPERNWDAAILASGNDHHNIDSGTDDR